MIHRQSAVQLKFSEQGNLLGVFKRAQHMAQSVTCPNCESRAGTPCKEGKQFLPELEVHLERMEAFA